MPRAAVVFLLAVAAGVALMLAAGGDDRPLTVYAASSLRVAAPEIDSTARYSFAASRTQRLQIERGARADVFVSASAKEAQELHDVGRCDRPQTFATNRIVLLVPAASNAISSVQDLMAGGRRLAVGGPGVPVGDYARDLLARMGMSDVLRVNIVSSELSVAALVAKVASGAADAGFAYASDARAAAGRARALELPRGAQPPIEYQACVVRRVGANLGPARDWVARLAGAEAQSILARHGFGRP